MAGTLAHDSKQLQHRWSLARTIWVTGVAGNTHETIFGNRAGCPGLMGSPREPTVGALVVNVVGVGKSKEHVYLE